MPKSKVVLRNASVVFGNIQKLVGKARKAVIVELNTIGEEIILDSRQNYVPVDTGHLRSTGRVDHADPNTKSNSVRVGLGFWAKYAAAVHEQNKAYKNGKTWKYLTTPLNRKKRTVKPRLNRAMQDALK